MTINTDRTKQAGNETEELHWKFHNVLVQRKLQLSLYCHHLKLIIADNRTKFNDKKQNRKPCGKVRARVRFITRIPYA